MTFSDSKVTLSVDGLKMGLQDLGWVEGKDRIQMQEEPALLWAQKGIKTSQEVTSMKSSTDRIITTHAGSLPRPPELLKLIKAKAAGQPFDEKELSAEVKRSVEAITKRQADLGLDVISDGEMSKPSFLSYIVERLGGVTVTAEPVGNPWKDSRENKSFPEYYAWEASLNLSPASGAKRVVCDGPLTYKGHPKVAADIATF